MSVDSGSVDNLRSHYDEYYPPVIQDLSMYRYEAARYDERDDRFFETLLRLERSMVLITCKHKRACVGMEHYTRILVLQINETSDVKRQVRDDMTELKRRIKDLQDRIDELCRARNYEREEFVSLVQKLPIRDSVTFKEETVIMKRLYLYAELVSREPYCTTARTLSEYQRRDLFLQLIYLNSFPQESFNRLSLTIFNTLIDSTFAANNLTVYGTPTKFSSLTTRIGC